MDPLDVSFAAVLAAMFALWLLSLALRNASIVDIWWGPAFAGIAGLSLWMAPHAPGARALLAAIAATVWGLRLGAYLLWRSWGEGEDWRYRAMRKRHGERFAWLSLFTVFGMQGVGQWIISLPLQVSILAPPTELGWPAALGGASITTGFLFEAVGDWQLARFKADPANAGRVMDRGLWRYTRHPNYFGDFLVWWGFYALACGVPGGWWTLPGPVLMSIVLLRISGVALLERSLVDRKPGYRDYVERTSAFLPRPPRR